MANIALLRQSPRCVQCGNMVFISPEWSESAKDQKTIHIWHCLVCGHEFETIDELLEHKPSDAELIEKFMPNLLVA